MKDRYFEGISRESIIVCGIYPPPLGGVSIHIQRVTDYLTRAYNKIAFFNVEHSSRRIFLPYYLLRLISFLIKKRPTQIHFHGTYLSTMIFDVTVLSFFSYVIGYKLIIIEHDCRHLYKRKPLTRWLYARIIRLVQKVVMIGDVALQSYKNQGITADHFSVENAFLPPPIHTAPSIRATYPSSLSIFLKERTPLILMNAAHIMLRDDKDVYGLDASVEMTAYIKKKYPDMGLIMAIAEVNNSFYMGQLYQKMRQLDAAEQIYILQDQKEIWPLFKQIDLFIRPTLSDGASISVEEALYFNLPVVASDVVIRPKGVWTYNIANHKDLFKTVELVLQEQVYGIQRKHNNLHEKSFR